MFSLEKLMQCDESALSDYAKEMGPEDLNIIIGLLSEQNDKIRYKAFLLTKKCSEQSNIVYPYWDTFKSKLTSRNSYQRSIGAMLIAENAKWDKENHIDSTIDEYLTLLNDEKPITIRQCIQALDKIITYKPHLCVKIAEKLMAVDIASLKDTMKKLILTDILNILINIKKHNSFEALDSYILNALSGGIIDNKTAKQLSAKI